MSDAVAPVVPRCLGALLLLTLLAGCAGIPTSGPVRDGGPLRLERVQDVVPFIGQPPASGAAPEDIVRGFLRSGADFVNDHEVARLYLTSTAAQGWRPQAGTVVYDRVAAEPASVVARGAPSESASPTSTVTVTGAEVGRIDAEGAFRRAAPDTPTAREFRLQRVRGEWRIAGLDDGLMLSEFDVAEAYRQVSMYFLAPSGTRLVPDTVLIPELPGLTTKVVARLLRGPTESLRASVRTGFLSGTELQVNSVPVRDGLATVSLDDSALQADDTARAQMSAQLVWTLTQLPEVAGVRIEAGGESFATAGAAEEQDRGSWRTFDPDAAPGVPSAYLVRDGAVGRYLEGEFEPVPGPAGSGATALRSPAVSLDGTRLAAVSADGSRLLVGRREADTALEERLVGADLSRPSWDPGDNLWVVDRASGALWYLADGAERAEEVAVPRPVAGRLRLREVAVSRDGSRVALVLGAGVDARLRVGGVTRVESADPDLPGGEALAVTAVVDPLPDLREVRDVGWADAATLAVVAARGEGPVLALYVGTDGYLVEAEEPLLDVVRLTSSPPRQQQTHPPVAATADGQVWQLSVTEGWRPLGPGSDPAYPG